MHLKLCFDNVYDTIELYGGENILQWKQITKTGIQSPEREQQAQFDHMKAMCFLLSEDKKRYNLLFNRLRDGYKEGRD